MRPAYITFALLVPPLIGHYQLGSEHMGEATAGRYCCALIVLLFGYLLARVWLGGRPSASLRRPLPSLAAIRLTLLILLALVGIRYLLGGVPIFSGDVEVSRFTATGGGILGVLGRIQVFALPLALGATMFCTFRLPRADNQAWHRMLAYFLAAYLVIQLLSGFRSALLTLLLAVLFTAFTAVPTIRTVRVFAPVGLALLLAIVFAVQLSSAYATVSGQRGVDTILKRATVGAAEPGFVVMQKIPFLPKEPPNSLLNDVGYFGQKYALVFGSPTDQFPFEQVVSARLLHQPLIATNRYVPVTVGAIPQSFYDFGIWTLLIMCVLGACYAALEYAALTAGSISSYLWALSGIFILHEYLTKGNGAYVALNWIIMGALVTGLLWLARRKHDGNTALS